MFEKMYILMKKDNHKFCLPAYTFINSSSHTMRHAASVCWTHYHF